MQSKTSSFKALSPALFLKNMTRFWPLWAVYAAVWLVMLPLVQFVTAFGRSSRSGQTLEELLGSLHAGALRTVIDGGLVTAVIFGVLFAMALFSYLTSARSVGMFHSFPIRREGLFLTNYLSGVAVFVAVQVVSVVLTGLIQMGAGGANWGFLAVGLLCSLAQMLFFYSFAVFCAMFTGQVLAIPAFYGVLNILAQGLCTLVQWLADGLYFGYSSGAAPQWVQWLTPVEKMMDVSVNMDSETWFATGVSDGSILAVYALVGVALAALALAVYRRRPSETAGDTVAIRWAKPVFLWGVAVCCALSLGQGLYYLTWTQMIDSDGLNFPALLVCMVVLGVVGYFAAAMLLRKSFKVFRTAWKSAAALAAVLVVLGAALQMDVLGVENRVPDVADITSIEFHMGGMTSANGSLNDQESFRQITDLHRAILAEKDEEKDSSPGYLDLTYYLTDGSRVSRFYSVGENEAGNSQAAELYRQLATDPKIQRANMLDGVQGSRLTGGELSRCDLAGAWDHFSMDANVAQIVYDAMVADIDAGNFGVTALMEDREWAEHVYVSDLTFFLQREGWSGNYASSFTFSTQCVNLVKALEEVGAVDAKHPLQTYLELYPEDYAYEELESEEGWGDLVPEAEIPAYALD